MVERFLYNQIMYCFSFSNQNMDCSEKLPVRVQNAPSMQLTEKSQKLYKKTYASFCQWQLDNSVTTNTEDALLKYFKAMRKECKASSLITEYCHLKYMIECNTNINIDRFCRLRALMKTFYGCNEQTLCKQEVCFTFEQMETYIRFAPDVHHLFTKVCIVKCRYGQSTKRNYVIKWE